MPKVPIEQSSLSPGQAVLAGESQAEDTELMASAREKLATLPLVEAAAAGFVRDRTKYFLNISYPSMQAMNKVSEPDVYDSPEASESGRDIALYVHVPFCQGLCYYCHYYKEFKKPKTEVDQYLDSVETELSLHANRLGELRAKSVYVGGGTPSYMEVDQINRLFSIIGRNVAIQPGAEVSFEVHPETADEARLEALRANGVNRINIGIESFDDNLLAAENRRHTAEEALGVIALAKAMGFKNVNLDLIYGLKHQTPFIWERTLDTVRQLKPDSATMYYLRLKRNTPEYNMFVHHRDLFPPEADILLMHAMNFERMENEMGYTQNPVDWFIRDPDLFHQYQDHNWRRSDETELLGIGPSAYSYVNGWQYYNINQTPLYNALLAGRKVPIWKGEKLEGDERLRRTLMLGIKMGIDRQIFKRTYGVDVVDAFPEEVDSLQELGLISVDGARLVLTYMGKLLADEVGQLFYSPNMRRRMQLIEPDMISTTWPMLNK